MMSRRVLCHIVRAAWISLALTLAAIADAQPVVTVARLQQLLQEAPKRELRFAETRESPWLSAPLESSGRMRSSVTMLEKEVLQPKRETWLILDDRLQLTAAGDASPRQIMFGDAPAVATLANALRRMMAGDLEALDKDFNLAPGGDERLWTLRLTPRRQDTARFLKELELQGTGPDVQVVVILESHGERTTTRLTHEP